MTVNVSDPIGAESPENNNNPSQQVRFAKKLRKYICEHYSSLWQILLNIRADLIVVSYIQVPVSQMSPPRPISTLQHNYSNIQQPAPVMPNRSLPTPPPMRNGYSNGSIQTLGLPTTNGTAVQNNKSSSPSIQISEGAFSRSAVRPRTPNTDTSYRRRERNLISEEAKRSKLAELRDLIHLEPPLSEDAILRVMQARFFNQKYYVSIFI